jgi:hypothetical protein
MTFWLPPCGVMVEKSLLANSSANARAQKNATPPAMYWTKGQLFCLSRSSNFAPEHG